MNGDNSGNHDNDNYKTIKQSLKRYEMEKEKETRKCVYRLLLLLTVTDCFCFVKRLPKFTWNVLIMTSFCQY